MLRKTGKTASPLHNPSPIPGRIRLEMAGGCSRTWEGFADMKKNAAVPVHTSLAAVLAILIAVSAWGQGATGTITGTVTDPSGASMAGATVTETNIGTAASTKTTTNASGEYVFVQLPPGMYAVTVEAQGFRKVTMSAQRLVVASTLRMNVTMEVGQVTESVTVDTTAPQVNTDDAQLGESVTNIPDLPLLSTAGGRNALALVSLQPGVAVTQSDSPGAVVGPFAVNGQRSQANNFLLDGADDNDLAINTPDAMNVISPNALGEFRVVTGPMKAEYGRNSGAVVEGTIKSGSNHFHGGASEIFRNKVLNANNFFLNSVGAPNPQYNSNDFDVNFGGPVIRNRTFFFASYLGFRRVEGQANAGTVFSDAERAAILANGTDAAKNVVNITPRATDGGNQWIGSAVDNLNRDQGVMRIDHRFSDANNLSVSYFTERTRDNAPFAFLGAAPTVPGFGELNLFTYHNVILHDTHAFGATLVNDATAAYHRLDAPTDAPANKMTPSSLGFNGIVPDDPSNAGPPFISIGDITLGNTYQGPQARFDNQWQYRDTVSWIKGRHSLKFGVEYSAYEQNQRFDFINNGYLFFGGGFTEGAYGPALPVLPGLENSDPSINDFAQGYVDFYDQSNALKQGYRDKFLSAFVQDDFKVTRNFTLNVGLRWDYGAPLTEVHDQMYSFRPGQQSTVFPTAPVGLVYPGDTGVSSSTYRPDYNNFGPRLGFAWDPTGSGKLSIRGGGGLFYNVPESELTLQFLGTPPYGAQVISQGVTDMTNPYATSLFTPLPQNPFPFRAAKPGDLYDFTQLAPLGLTIMDPKFATPYAFQYDLQVQYQFAKDWVANAAYVGSLGRKLEDRRDINPALPTPDATSGDEPFRRVFNINNPQDAQYFGAVFGSITTQLTDANSSYNSLQLSLEKRLSYGLQLTNSYTYSHCIDDASGLRVASNPFDSRYDRGNCDTDVRQAYVGTAIYNLPFMKDQRGFLGHVLGGFTISTVVTLQSGIPFDIVDTADRSLTGSGDDRPDFLGGNVSFIDPRDNAFGRANSYFDGTGGGTSTAGSNPYFRRVGSGPAAALGAGRYGDFGRNVFHGPGILNADVSLTKNIRITEGQTLRLNAQAFNFFNHTQFRTPVGIVNSTAFGRVTTAHDPRLVQLSMQYTF